MADEAMIGQGHQRLDGAGGELLHVLDDDEVGLLSRRSRIVGVAAIEVAGGDDADKGVAGTGGETLDEFTNEA